jgi:hypothetical protein
MNIAIKPGRPGSARVEYYACREDVEAMLAKGHTARAAYEYMKEQGRVTCSYSAFCDYVRGKGKRKHSTSKKKRQGQLQTPTPAIQQTSPRIIRPAEPRKFTYPPSEEDLKALF